MSQLLSGVLRLLLRNPAVRHTHLAKVSSAGCVITGCVVCPCEITNSVIQPEEASFCPATQLAFQSFFII